MDDIKTNRRHFLQWCATAALSLAPSRAEPCDTPHVRRYTTLGRTGLKVSDIGFGSQYVPAKDTLVANIKHALDRGINYFDTSEAYTLLDTSNRVITVEEVLGSVLKSVRDDVVITTKVYPWSGGTEDEYMSNLEAALKRLQTDVIDVYMLYSVESLYDLQFEPWHSFVAKAKEQGKIRYTGLSSHSGNIADLMTYALDQDLVDVVLLAYTFAEDPRFFEPFSQPYIKSNAGLPHILKRAKELDVGVTVMKVQQGGRHNELGPYTSDSSDGEEFARAAIRWALSNPNVDTVVTTMRSTDTIDRYLGASGYRQLAAGDYKRLYRHAMERNASYCRFVCNDCAGACPYGVPISDVMRMRMYAVDYRNPDLARREYAQLETNAEACLSCTGAPCADACTYNLPIAKLCAPTHRMLA